ncbi:MAG: glycosyltransferase [Verrucomicrobia bacterium]|nr:glycosyltransferase [Verrucomicrobiota bacterium]MBV9643469.1 glycosyltransferase [Verrucomicrobiota bacterium]
MKKILIFTAGFGEGHNTAARNIRDAVEHIAPDEAKVEVLDLFDACYGKLNDLVRKAYITAINRTPRVWGKIYSVIDGTQFVESNMAMLAKMKRAMSDVLAELEPDAVVSTYPIYNYVIDAIFSDGRPKSFSQSTVITDSITVNSIWYRCVSDYFLVANGDTANVLRNAGVPEQQMRIFGFPVTYRFAEMPDNRYRSGEKGPRRVLYLINSGKKEAPALVRRLCKRPDLQLTIIVGRDRTLRKEIESEIKAPANPVDILGWSNRLPELLMGHHLVITKAGGATVQESIAARTPVIISQVVPGQEEGNARLIVENDCGCLAPDPEALLEALDGAFNHGERRLQTWVTNISKLSKPDASLQIARFLLELASPENAPPKKLPHFLRTQSEGKDGRSILLCDLHTHSVYSDGKLTVRELVDFYGQRSFDVLCVTDHICDHTSLIGKMTNLSGLVLTIDEVEEYFETIESEKKRALEKYRMILMAGFEFNKDGLAKKSSAHLLAVDLKAPIDPGLSIIQTIAEIHSQGGLAIASHPHEVKTRWGKNTLFFWENIDRYAPLLDAWEVANRDDLFNPIGLKRLPFVANSDFHKPKHIFSWKTVLFCNKDAEAIKQCIRVNRDVSITLFRDHRIGFGYGASERAARFDFAENESAKEVVEFPTYGINLA